MYLWTQQKSLKFQVFWTEIDELILKNKWNMNNPKKVKMNFEGRKEKTYILLILKFTIKQP